MRNTVEHAATNTSKELHLKQPIPLLLALVAATLGPSQALATGAATANTLEEVIVTAQKRTQSLQEVPIAVTVVRGDAMEKAQVRDLRDLQRLTTSLVVAQADSATNQVFSIRGMSTSGFNAGLESAVGVVIDGVYRGRQLEAVDDLVDVDQVEVLRGPQSTLFGKNTTAGVINIRTKAPNFESGGFYSATLGNPRQLQRALSERRREHSAHSVDGGVAHFRQLQSARRLYRKPAERPEDQ